MFEACKQLVKPSTHQPTQQHAPWHIMHNLSHFAQVGFTMPPLIKTITGGRTIYYSKWNAYLAQP